MLTAQQLYHGMISHTAHLPMFFSVFASSLLHARPQKHVTTVSPSASSGAV